MLPLTLSFSLSVYLSVSSVCVVTLSHAASLTLSFSLSVCLSVCLIYLCGNPVTCCLSHSILQSVYLSVSSICVVTLSHDASLTLSFSLSVSLSVRLCGNPVTWCLSHSILQSVCLSLYPSVCVVTLSHAASLTLSFSLSVSLSVRLCGNPVTCCASHQQDQCRHCVHMSGTQWPSSPCQVSRDWVRGIHSPQAGEHSPGRADRHTDADTLTTPGSTPLCHHWLIMWALRYHGNRFGLLQWEVNADYVIVCDIILLVDLYGCEYYTTRTAEETDRHSIQIPPLLQIDAYWLQATSWQLTRCRFWYGFEEEKNGSKNLDVIYRTSGLGVRWKK